MSNNQLLDNHQENSEKDNQSAISSQTKYAQESDKTKRAREKLRKRLEILEKEISENALKEKIIEIHDRISRYASSRVVLKGKSISLFDNNQNPAESSKKIAKVALQIQEKSKIFMQSLNSFEKSLKGRAVDIQ